jgi:hypothetical protein
MSAPVASKIRSPSRAQHGHQGEVARVGRLAGGGQHGLELQVGEPQRRGLGRHGWPADVVGWGMLQYCVDNAGPVEPGRDGEAP